jgi:branched-chain amino acid transport system substrate-binding protein
MSYNAAELCPAAHKESRMYFRLASALLGLASCCSVASAQEITVGITATFTGPNAANGVPYRNAEEIFPHTLGGVPVKYIVLDDATDPTLAAKNARTFVDDKVDAILGSTSNITAAAIMDTAVQSETPQIAWTPVPISAAHLPWVFALPQPVPLMVSAIIANAKQHGVKRIAFLGYSDGWGDLNIASLTPLAKAAGISVVAEERFGRTDTSVTAQALKIIAADPDAVFIGASGTSGALPETTLRDQGFTGLVYQTHGSAMKPFIDALGSAGNGTMLPAGPVIVANDLPDSNPIKAVSLDFIHRYDAKWGAGTASPISGYAWDGMLVLDSAAGRALKKAKPGTPEFRVALRDALQDGTEVVGTNAVYKFTPTDHFGVDERSRVMVVIENGAFHLAQ